MEFQLSLPCPVAMPVSQGARLFRRGCVPSRPMHGNTSIHLKREVLSPPRASRRRQQAHLRGLSRPDDASGPLRAGRSCIPALARSYCMYSYARGQAKLDAQAGT